MPRILISTGEVSGDLQGSLLVKALYREAFNRSISLEVIALGGPRMKAAGAHLIADTSHMGAIGLWEAIPFILPTLRIQSKVDGLLKKNPPDAVVLIDYMGPNIRLGNKLRLLQPEVPITYYIAPQEWAWRIGDGGSTDLISFSDRILAIFKAEADFYKQLGGKVSWVGHPMLDTLKDLPDRQEAFHSLGLEIDKRVLLLLPASRSQEIRYLMPTLARAAALLQQYDPLLSVFVPAGLESFEGILQDIIETEGVKGKVIPAKKVDSIKPILFAAADLALGKSGTINMELALHGVPQIVGYRVSRITAFLARKVLNFSVDHISPVNLLLKERLVPELIQEEFCPKRLFEIAVPLLEDNKIRSQMLEGYDRLRKTLGSPGVTDRAAKEILDLILI